MDRFIDHALYSKARLLHYLKSSMDRFIACEAAQLFKKVLYLKSSMDRFIGIADADEVDRFDLSD